MVTMNKVMFWGVTVLAIAFLFFPSYVEMLFGSSNNAAVSENMDRAVFQIDGMASEGCASTVTQAIRQVPGGVAVEVSYETSTESCGQRAAVKPTPK